MLATFDALLAQPVVLLVVLAVGAVIGIAVEKFFAGIERDKRRAYYAGRNGAKGSATTAFPSNRARNPSLGRPTWRPIS